MDLASEVVCAEVGEHAGGALERGRVAGALRVCVRRACLGERPVSEPCKRIETST
jgi:hypothetical protein